MTEPTSELEDARAAGAGLAADYDAVPYVPGVEPQLDLERILGLAAVYGAAVPAEPSLLDIGCGVGVQLARWAGQTSGAVTGTDISAAACAAARTRLSGRATILRADVLDLDIASLGTFDVIACVGVIYVTPPAVKARVFEIVGRCLRPGGVAVLSYYCGSAGALRAELYRQVRAAVDQTLPPRHRVAQARAWLQQGGGQWAQAGADLPVQALRALAGLDEATLFHEGLAAILTSTQTSAVAAGLAGQGLSFLSYLHPMPYCGLAEADQRAQGADLFDFMHGGYRYAAFLKGEAAAPVAARAPRWRSGLVRHGPAEFHDPALGALRIASPVGQAVLDALATGPTGGDALLARIAAMLSGGGLAPPPDLRQRLDAELQQLWQPGWLAPLV